MDVILQRFLASLIVATIAMLFALVVYVILLIATSSFSWLLVLFVSIAASTFVLDVLTHNITGSQEEPPDERQ